MTFLNLIVVTISVGQTPAISPEIKSQTIDTLFAAMRQNYVFPDVEAKAEAKVRANLAAHAYDTIQTGPDFAERLTEDLRSVCHDAHLRVRFSPEALPERTHANQPSPGEIAQQRVMVKKINAGFERVERLRGNVGLVKFNFFASPEDAEARIRAAMDFVADTDALIFDLRDNGGGDPATVRLLCSYLFDSPPVHLNDIYDRTANRTDQFWTLSKVPGRKYVGKSIHLLVGKRTSSGAEEFAYDLKTQRRATLIGESTWGGANPGSDFRLNDHFTAFVPNGRAINPITHTNWEGTGVDPDVHVPEAEALRTAHRLALGKLVAAQTDPGLKAMYQQALEDVSK